MAFCETCKGLGCIECYAAEGAPQGSGVRSQESAGFDDCGIGSPILYFEVVNGVGESLHARFPSGYRQTRRQKLLLVPGQLMLDLLQGLDRYEVYQLQHWDVPPGARVVGVHYDYDCQCWALQIEHESFDDIHPGDRLPHINACDQVEVVRIARLEPIS